MKWWQRRWWVDVGDGFGMLVSKFRCWWHLLNIVARRLCKKTMEKTTILKLSPTHLVSNTRHQHGLVHSKIADSRCYFGSVSRLWPTSYSGLSVPCRKWATILKFKNDNIQFKHSIWSVTVKNCKLYISFSNGPLVIDYYFSINSGLLIDGHSYR